MSSDANNGANSNNQGSNVSRQGNQALAILEYNNPDNRTDAAPAIQPPPSEGRQPQTLQEVLRYSIAATTDSAQAQIPPMDNERRAFLEASLHSFAHSTVDRMKACVEVLLSDNTQDDDQATCEEALEQIIDLVDNMDNASDFHKIGGFRILDPGLHSTDETLRALTATLIAELSQNNVYIQDRILETDLLALLLDMVDGDPDPGVRVKSLYAVSCVVRDHEAGLAEFSARDGWTVLLGALQSGVEKLQLKACFLLSAVCAQRPAAVDGLCELGYVEQLCGLLAGAPTTCPLVEHLLRALLAMAANCGRAVEACSLPQLQLRRTLSDVLESSERDMDDYRYAQEIKALVFGSSYEDAGER